MKNQIAKTQRRHFPSFDCPNPNCGAKNIIFAPNADTKNRSELIPLESLAEADAAECIVNCPKCKNQFAMIYHRSIPIIPLEFIPYISYVST